MFLSPRAKRLLSFLILIIIAGALYLRHEQVAEKGPLGWYDHAVLFVASPLAKGITLARNAIRATVDKYFLLVGVSEENKRLQKALDEFRLKESLFAEINSENRRLQEILDLENKFWGEEIAARVVAVPPFGEYRIITIDKGLKDGIKRRSPVVAPAGLVGQVLRVEPNQSHVLLITDPTSSIDARVMRTGARGLVVGRAIDLGLKRELFVGAVDFMDRTSDVEEGDLVVTTGLAGHFPSGIPIGEIRDLSRKRADVFLDAKVIPHVNPNRLHEVIVLVPK